MFVVVITLMLYVCSFFSNYVKVMNKVMEKGNTYVFSELSRLEKLVEQHIPSEKKVEMLRKKNVLDVFRRATERDEL